MEKGSRWWQKVQCLPLRLMLLALCAWAVYTISTGLISPSLSPSNSFPRQEVLQLFTWQVNHNRPVVADGSMLKHSFEKSFRQDSKHNTIDGSEPNRTKENSSLKSEHYEESAKNTKYILFRKNNRFGNPKRSIASKGSEEQYRNANMLHQRQPKTTNHSLLERNLKFNGLTNNAFYSGKDFKASNAPSKRKIYTRKKNEFKFKPERNAVGWGESKIHLQKNTKPELHKGVSKHIGEYGLKYKYIKTFMGTQLMPSISLSNYQGTTNQEITLSSQFSNRLTKVRTILLWSSLYKGWNFLTTGPDAFSNCSEIRCEVTSDRNRLKDSHAVVFHVRTMSLLDLPAFRLPHQKWIFFSLESPPQSYFPGFHFMRGMFNWTMTYRGDSDIVIPYGRVIASSYHKNNTRSRKDWKSLWKKKTRQVIWMVSHCNTYSKRELYVHQLQKFIDVDILGGCGAAVCLFNETNKCLESFSRRYKFFLAFENSICDYYVTEKFFRALKYDIVPVVLGGADYKALAPPGSYINAADYPSPKALADYLHIVSENFTHYRTYLTWKDAGYMIQDTPSHCSLCEKIHSSKFSATSTYSNMVKWWVEDSHCTKGTL